MAVTKTEYLVNGGNIGWSNNDVIAALETAFAGLGWHSGTAKTGVPTTVLAPGSSQPVANSPSGNFQYATPDLTPEYSRYNRRYNVTNSGSSSYNIERKEIISYIYGSNYAGNEGWIRLYDCNDIATGTAMVYHAGANTIPNRNGTTNPMFVDGQTYYVINIDQDDWVRFADSQSDAVAGTYIDPPAGAWSGENYGNFTEDLGNNPTLVVRQGDRLYFDIVATGHPMYLQDQSGAYSSTRLLNNTNFNGISYRSFPANQGIEVGTLDWTIDSWSQGDFYYVCQFHSAMSGIIRVLPSAAGYTLYGDINSNAYDDQLPYWDYTVSAGGVAGKTDLQLRIKRQAAIFGTIGRLHSIEIMNEATGWSNDESFTILGSGIGGVSPTNDIVFGTNSLTTQQQTDRNGVCSLKVTNFGAGSSFYQRFNEGGILRLEHDAGKTYGHTYYGFRLSSTNNYQIYIGSGVEWKARNYYPDSTNWNYKGEWGGQQGMDVPAYGYHLDNDVNKYKDHSFCSSTTPTQYPLKIVTHKATSPQDTNFATVTFVHTINSVDYAYLTFSPLKGTAVGSGIWDLDYVWNGSYLTVDANTYGGDENIELRVYYPWTYNANYENAGSLTTVRREAFYGFRRDPESSGQSYYYWTDNYSNNIHESQGNNVSQILGYYRNSTYDYVYVNLESNTTGNKADAIQNIPVNSAANYYRPFKGLPLNSNMMPCPYYLPDDFTIIQFAVTPGATTFTVGDTITVSAGEIYEIIQVYYTTNQTASDEISGNTSQGIAFCARTT